MRIQSDFICEGGDLDCGSGLLLIIKKSMDFILDSQILEIQSTENSVQGDIPAWCRMVGHEYLGFVENEIGRSYFVKKKSSLVSSLSKDLEALRGFEWSTRARLDSNRVKIYARNHTIFGGLSTDVSPNVESLGGVDLFLASLSSCLMNQMKSIAAKRKILIDAMELTLKANLDNILVAMDMDNDGSPSIKQIRGTLYITSPAKEEDILNLWKDTLKHSAIYCTVIKSVPISIQLNIVL